MSAVDCRDRNTAVVEFDRGSVWVSGHHYLKSASLARPMFSLRRGLADDMFQRTRKCLGGLGEKTARNGNESARARFVLKMIDRQVKSPTGAAHYHPKPAASCYLTWGL